MTPEKVTIHCSVTKNGETCDIEKIREWHKAKGWTDIGYHFVTQPDGETQNGRSLTATGAHVEGHNTGNIGICLIGTDKFTQRQFDSLHVVLESLRMLYSIKPWNISCHYEYDTAIKQGKTCPNMKISNILSWYLVNNTRAIEGYLHRSK